MLLLDTSEKDCEISSFAIHHLNSVSNHISLPLGCRPKGPAHYRTRKTLIAVRGSLKDPPRRHLGGGGGPNDQKSIRGPPQRAPPTHPPPPPALCEGTIGCDNGQHSLAQKKRDYPKVENHLRVGRG